jgi:aldehyde:ferredoxin oxidoreductase
MADLKSINGKILMVNLTTGDIAVDEPEAAFYRKYLGGGSMGTYYILNGMPAKADPLGPHNVITFCPGVLTGGAFSGASRFSVNAKSPLTGCIGDSQCGGNFGPALKWAGFDAVVVTGRADKPVYLWIHDGEAELRDASNVWGKFTADTRTAIAEELGESKIRMACIGPAGERLVRFANVSGDGSDYAGRTGMGAVMGSKNLKAVVAKGDKKPEYADAETVKAIGRKGAESFKTSGFPQMLKEFGTSAGTEFLSGMGCFPTRNCSRGSFDRVKGLSGETMKKTIGHGSQACFGCVVRCRQTVKADEPYVIDPEYGAPEYETIGMLGGNLEIDDIAAVARANMLCNAYGMDTINTGAAIAWLIECYENELIPSKAVKGLDLRFGNPEVLLQLVEMIGERQGIGDLLSKGLEACVAECGAATAEYAVHVKNNAIPAHLPQVKKSQALAYAVNPFGADHMSTEHDSIIMAIGPAARGLGLDAKRDLAELDHEKVRMVVYTQYYYSLLDALSLCMFCWGPGSLFSYDDLVQLINAATGWDVTFWELMKAGERRVNMMRAFNAREGIDSQYDRLPPRVFKPMPGPGAGQGAHVPVEAFDDAVKTYYRMMNWDDYSGVPSVEKLQELGLDWISAV